MSFKDYKNEVETCAKNFIAENAGKYNDFASCIADMMVEPSIVYCSDDYNKRVASLISDADFASSLKLHFGEKVSNLFKEHTSKEVEILARQLALGDMDSELEDYFDSIKK